MTAGSPASLRVQSPALTEGRSGTVSGIQPTTKSPPLIHHLKTNALDQAVTFVERESVRHRGLARAERPAWRPLSRPLPQSSAVSGTGGFETDDREGAIERAGVGAPLLVVSSGPGQHCRPLVTLEPPGPHRDPPAGDGDDRLSSCLEIEPPVRRVLLPEVRRQHDVAATIWAGMPGPPCAEHRYGDPWSRARGNGAAASGRTAARSSAGEAGCGLW